MLSFRPPNSPIADRNQMSRRCEEIVSKIRAICVTYIKQLDGSRPRPRHREITERRSTRVKTQVCQNVQKRRKVSGAGRLLFTHVYIISNVGGTRVDPLSTVHCPLTTLGARTTHCTLLIRGSPTPQPPRRGGRADISSTLLSLVS